MPEAITQSRERDITELLSAWQDGSAEASDELFQRVYPALKESASKALSRQGASVTLQVTEVVHEAFLRLTGRGRSWVDRGHFFAYAAILMRTLLVDHYRSKRRQKRLGVSVEPEGVPALELSLLDEPDFDVLELDRALTELAREDPLAARIVEVRYFAGFSVEETAEGLGVGRSTVVRRWRFARAWLRRFLADEGSG